MSRRLVLASASPARLRVLQTAGLAAEVVVSGVDEDAVVGLAPAATVAALARRKAEAVAPRAGGALVLGCDSLLELGGAAYGKPASAAEARQWWRARRGCRGRLHTGHCLLDPETGRRAEEVSAATVVFGEPTDEEIAAYVASGEPLAVAGAFTIDGRGAAWVTAVEGNPGTVLGLSVPVLRHLLGQLGVALVDLWA